MIALYHEAGGKENDVGAWQEAKEDGLAHTVDEAYENRSPLLDNTPLCDAACGFGYTLYREIFVEKDMQMRLTPI